MLEHKIMECGSRKAMLQNTKDWGRVLLGLYDDVKEHGPP
jgi:hypothetical protein